MSLTEQKVTLQNPAKNEYKNRQVENNENDLMYSQSVNENLNFLEKASFFSSSSKMKTCEGYLIPKYFWVVT